jgi:hypothetical protein
LRRRIGVIGAVLVLAAGLAVPAASAARHMLVGIQDDAQTLYGNPTTTFPILRQLRVQVIRVGLTRSTNVLVVSAAFLFVVTMLFI